MNVSLAKAKKLARSLLRENRKNGRSWRVIAREDYSDRVNYATLNRFANSKGTWIPKDEHILIALGLITPRRQQPKTIFDMSVEELLTAIRDREAMPPVTYSKRAMTQFIRACKNKQRERLQA
jgi:hypothetical protein